MTFGVCGDKQFIMCVFFYSVTTIEISSMANILYLVGVLLQYAAPMYTATLYRQSTITVTQLWFQILKINCKWNVLLAMQKKFQECRYRFN